MNKWIDRLVAQVNTKTHADNLTYKTYETLPDEKENALQDSFVGFVGDFPGACSENTPADQEAIIERAAIVEYDGETTKDQANLQAARAYDRQRQSYEFANPGRDPNGVEALYRAYISDFVPTECDPLPAVPPCTKNNTDLWRAWWRVVEEGKNNG